MPFEPNRADAAIAEHYAPGQLLNSIETALAEVGKSPESVSRQDLLSFDEFHFGGRGSTDLLCEQLELGPGSDLIDIGSGIGGPARHIAAEYQCQVTGLDLTPEFVEVATTLTSWVGLDAFARFKVGSALDMPFDDCSFDVATQLHVGMNIEDKAKLFAEVARTLKPGGLFGVYDIMSISDAGHEFPVPWATHATSSYVAGPDAYVAALTKAGLDIVSTHDRTEESMAFTTAGLTAAAERPPSALSLGLLMGHDTQLKLMNLVAAIGNRTLAPTEIICRKA